jgi:hypothetical protein
MCWLLKQSRFLLQLTEKQIMHDQQTYKRRKKQHRINDKAMEEVIEIGSVRK